MRFLPFFFWNSIKLWNCETRNKSQHVLRCEIKNVDARAFLQMEKHLPFNSHYFYLQICSEGRKSACRWQRESFVVGPIISRQPCSSERAESRHSHSKNNETIYHHCSLCFQILIRIWAARAEVKFQINSEQVFSSRLNQMSIMCSSYLVNNIYYEVAVLYLWHKAFKSE